MNKSYIASLADIRNLTADYLQAGQRTADVRSTYLRCLIATTQKELGAEQRSNNAKRPKLSDEDREAQLKALAAVHARFYPIVMAEAEKTIKDIPSKDRAQVLNRRTNFARTAIYAARMYVRMGKDLTGLAPAKLSKSAIAVEVGPKVLSAKQLTRKLETASKSFMVAALALSESHPQAAVGELDLLIGQLASQLAALGVKAVHNPQEAADQHLPLRVGSQLFIPTASTVLRERARPS